jgi:hypothetical protein
MGTKGRPTQTIRIEIGHSETTPYASVQDALRAALPLLAEAIVARQHSQPITGDNGLPTDDQTRPNSDQTLTDDTLTA